MALGLAAGLIAGCSTTTTIHQTPTVGPTAAPTPAPTATPTTAPAAFSLPTATIGSATVFESNVTSTAAYTYSTDSANTSTCTGECLSFWPPISAPTGVTLASPWGSFTRTDEAVTQLTYNGLPLYTFVEDTTTNPGTGNGAVVGSGTFTFAVPQSNTAAHIHTH